MNQLSIVDKRKELANEIEEFCVQVEACVKDMDALVDLSILSKKTIWEKLVADLNQAKISVATTLFFSNVEKGQEKEQLKEWIERGCNTETLERIINIVRESLVHYLDKLKRTSLKIADNITQKQTEQFLILIRRIDHIKRTIKESGKTKTITEEISHCEEYVNEEVSKTDSSTSSTRFPSPPNLQWKDIIVTFTSDDTIKIKCGSITKKYHYSALGFNDKRSSEKKPVELWHILSDMASNNGQLLYNSSERFRFERRRKTEKQISRLRKHLKDFFQCDGDPIVWKKKGHDKGYHTVFTLRDERPSFNKRIQEEKERFEKYHGTNKSNLYSLENGFENNIDY